LSATIPSLHHVTATAAEARPDVRFYTRILGLRLVKKTVNFDNNGVYDFYYRDELGRPSTLMTTFPYAGKGVRVGVKGAGQITVTSFSMPRGSLEYWQQRFADAAVEQADPEERFGDRTLMVQDPSGLNIELVECAGDEREPWRAEGIDAAADMAMAKFVFRSLASDHPEPAEFLAAANEVVCDEIAPGKFITMLYLTVDGVRGELACAGAGHPSPRLVLPDGTVRSLTVRGLALGIETGQAYDELRETVPPGACVVVYTDGVVEARRGGELFGAERLDGVLAENRDLSAEELAHAVLAECRAFSRGELADDCAVVVIRRLPA
jgi:catechol 2,3-dioxygenase-like lactoylglutathione lyase family enzyme